MRILAVADSHIGKGSHLSPTRLAEQERVWDAILEASRDEQVDVVVHAGDAFDRRRPSPEEMLAFERPLVEHCNSAGAPEFIINGNGSHDAAYGQEPSPLSIFQEADLLTLFQEPGVHLSGSWQLAFLPWAPTSHLRARLDPDIGADEVNQAAAMLLIDIARELRSRIHGAAVLVTHFSVSGSLTPEGASVDLFREVILPLDELVALGFDAVILGHIHRGQLLSAKPQVFYTGSPMPLTFGEGGCDHHGYWIVDTEGSPRVEFRPIESPRFLTFDLEADLHRGSFQVANDVVDAYVRFRVTDPSEDFDPRDLERWLLDEGARYAKVEVTVERAARARVEALDEEVSEGDAFALWLDTQGHDDETRGKLLGLDQRYRETVGI